MGVVIDDRLRFRVLMIKSFRGCGMQQELLVDEVQKAAPISRTSLDLKSQDITGSQAVLPARKNLLLFRHQ
jgi:hypothetical protein